MKRSFSVLLLLCLVVASTPLVAQFRRNRNAANKEYELKAYNLAIEHYLAALERRPDDLESVSRIADSYRMLNQMQTAHKYYQQAVRDKKVDPQTVLQHADVLKATGQYDEAKQWFMLYARDYDAEVGNHYAQSCDFAKGQSEAGSSFVAESILVNSPVSDFGPTLPSAGQIVFNSARTAAGPAFDGQAKNAPYVATISPGDSYQPAAPLTTGYTDPSGNVGPVSYTPDGRQVIFTRNNFTAGTRMVPETGMTLSLLIADVNDQGTWLNPRPLPFNGTDFNTGYGTFSSDGNSIFFCSDRSEGFGGYDIYRVNREGQTWDAVPENLGTTVNSVGHEITPFFDGTSLFFSSNWHQGLGTYDVFRAEMNGGRATTLFHMGTGVNSSRDDIGFIYDPIGQTGYVVSNRIGGSGMEDVYRVTRKSNEKVLIVQSATDGSYLANTAVDLTSCGGQVYATDQNGRYVFESLDGLNCEIVISRPGYEPVRMAVNTLPVRSDNTVRVSLRQTGGVAQTDSGAMGQTAADGPDTTRPVGGGPTPPGTYRGRIVNAQTGYPVPMANVRVLQRSTGASANVLTSVDGDYILALDPNTAYDLVVTAANFETVKFPILNGDGSDQNILGVLTLLPAENVTTTAPPVTSTPAANPSPTSTRTPSTPAPSTPTTTAQPTTSAGYSVQLASLAKRPDLGRYTNVSDMGRVYDVPSGAAYKVRVGVYATRAEAEAVAQRAKAAGYDGAFVVEDTGAAAAAPSVATATPAAGQQGRYKSSARCIFKAGELRPHQSDRPGYAGDQ